jgi:hypothetical protein
LSNAFLQAVRSAVIAALIEIGQYGGKKPYVHRIHSSRVDDFFERYRVLSRNCHLRQKLLNFVKNDVLISEVAAESGLDASVDGQTTTFGIPIVLADGEEKFHFSRPSSEVPASLLVELGDEISSQIIPTSRSSTITELRNHASAAADDFAYSLLNSQK